MVLPSGRTSRVKSIVTYDGELTEAFPPQSVTVLAQASGASAIADTVWTDDGTSVLKLDPNPPRDANGHHEYCGDRHVVLINGSSFVGLRGFTIDGSDGELPEDGNAFACGFPSPWIFDGPLPRNAFVKPSGQTVTGLIGHTVACQPPPMTKF